MKRGKKNKFATTHNVCALHWKWSTMRNSGIKQQEKLTSSRNTRKVMLEPSVAVSAPSLVTRCRPLGACRGQCSRRAVNSALTPAVQLLEITFL